MSYWCYIDFLIFSIEFPAICQLISKQIPIHVQSIAKLHWNWIKLKSNFWEPPYTNLAETPQKPRRNLPVQKWINCPQGSTPIRGGDDDDGDDTDDDGGGDDDDDHAD